MPLVCQDSDHELPISSAHRHARQALGVQQHHIGVPRGNAPGRGCRGRDRPLPPAAQVTSIDPNTRTRVPRAVARSRGRGRPLPLAAQATSVDLATGTGDARAARVVERQLIITSSPPFRLCEGLYCSQKRSKKRECEGACARTPDDKRRTSFSMEQWRATRRSSSWSSMCGSCWKVQARAGLSHLVRVSRNGAQPPTAWKTRSVQKVAPYLLELSVWISPSLWRSPNKNSRRGSAPASAAASRPASFLLESP